MECSVTIKNFIFGNNMKVLYKPKKGLSLIELMIVIAIIGIMSSIAIPAYGNYLAKSRMAEMLASTNFAKVTVTDYIMYRGGAQDMTLNEAIALKVPTVETDIVSGLIVVPPGEIIVTGRGEKFGYESTDSIVLRLIPTYSTTTGGVTWECVGSNNNPEGSSSLLPSSCTQEPPDPNEEGTGGGR